MACGGVPKRPSADDGPGRTGGAMTESEPPPPQGGPTLRAHDARALIRFLVDAFGFEETAVYGEGDRVDHAQLSWPPGGGVMLGSVKGRPEGGGATAPASSGA